MSKHGINVNLTSDKKPLKQQTVIVAGGLAMWDGEQWVSMMDGCRHRPISWDVKWWAELPNSVHPPVCSDERGWPLVPYDPKGIPDGYEVVRVGWPEEGDSVIAVERETNTMLPCKVNPNYIGRRDSTAMTIIRPIPKPIRLPLAIVPHGWWVARDNGGEVWCYEKHPKVIALKWGWTNGDVEKLPPWIAAQLPKEWHELPWNQSAVQQQEGGEG